MMNRLVLIAMTLFLSACSHFFDKDNTPPPTPLTTITATVTPHRLWSAKIGSGAGDSNLKFNPTVVENTIYTANANGVVTATDKRTGNTYWTVDTGIPLTSGPGVGSGIVVMGGHDGEIIALQQTTGSVRWKKTIQGDALAKPAIDNHIVVIKTINGTVHALAAHDGLLLWSFQQNEPNFILRGSSAPLLREHALFVGFANGSLAKMNLNNGRLDWTHTIAVPEGAFSIQRMIDIDADPILFEHRVFAATYQGKITSLDWYSGKILWSHDMSSYTGMTADDHAIYISDAKSHVWAFDANNGLVNWRQTQLEARNVSSPVVMGRYIVVGDAEGYLHWLSKSDGHFMGREFVGNAIIATPVVENDVLYVLTQNGSLVAYTLSS